MPNISREVPIHIFHKAVKPHISSVMEPGYRQINLRKRVTRRGHPGISEQPMRQHLVHVTGVSHATVQIELGRTAQFSPLHVIVQVDLQGPLKVIL